MIILDTNLISEPLKPAPEARVTQWLDGQRQEQLFLTVISAAELLAGVEQMPLGRKRSALEDKIATVLHRFGEKRILAFDLPAARAYAVLRARAREAGFGITAMDAQIAAIAASRGFAVATRDTVPFIAAGVKVINPWDSAA